MANAPAEDVPLERIAGELYGLPLTEFIPKRTEQVRAARTEGDRELAAAIGRLAKPTVAAWLVNGLVRQRAQLIAQLLELGASLRQAQEDLDPDALRDLGAQRRRLVGRVADEASRVGAEHGQHPGQAVLDEVAESLNAAMVSAAAATAVASGRLVKALPIEGVDDAELDEYMALPPTPGRRAVLRAVPRPERDTAAERQREQARHAVEVAERAAARASRRAEDADSAVTDGEQRVDSLTDRTGELRGRIEDLRRRLNEAEHDLQAAEDALREHRGEQRAARRALDEAQEALEAARAAERRLR